MIEVRCHSGYRGEETPRHLTLGERNIEVEEVVDRWLSPDHRYFKLRSVEGDVFLVRHDVCEQIWELVFYEDAYR